MRSRITLYITLGALTGSAVSLHAQDRGGTGKAVYEKSCALCHAAGVAGAPKLGDAGEWSARLRAGIATLYRSAVGGTPNGMPAKGGNLSLSGAEVRAAVDYLVRSAGGAPKSSAAPGGKRATASARGAAKPAAGNPAQIGTAPALESAAETPTPTVVAAAPSGTPAQAAIDPNAFNRLLAPPGGRNPPPAEDGIHDPGNPGIHALQPPLESFQRLPRANAGNRVNWVAALGKKQIQPRWDLGDPQAEPSAMDLNIVREVKGSMPDVVYPHRQHTEWLDCSNCHPAIFVPQKGANQISMAAILLGQKCGVCHGKVAFPVSECRLCHSRKKDAPASSTAAVPAAEARK